MDIGGTLLSNPAFQFKGSKTLAKIIGLPNVERTPIAKNISITENEVSSHSLEFGLKRENLVFVTQASHRIRKKRLTPGDLRCLIGV